jgi:sorting nexin-9/18/33
VSIFLASDLFLFFSFQGAIAKRKECEKLASEGKMDAEQFQGIKRRTDVISYSTMAEMTHFREEMVREYSDMMKEYLTQQIAFYNRVITSVNS